VREPGRGRIADIAGKLSETSIGEEETEEDQRAWRGKGAALERETDREAYESIRNEIAIL
jgi:hypothetical protein